MKDGPSIPYEILDEATSSVAAELARTWESSGTRARLKSVGLDTSSAIATRTDLGAAASFSVSRTGPPPLTADVHFFSSSAALDAATIRLGTTPFARNGAYLVVVTTSADSSAAAAVVAAVSGDE